MAQPKRLAQPKQRCYVVEYTGDNRATFECQHGHKWKGRLLRKLPTRISESMLKFMAGWWSKESGGVNMHCPKCKKEKA